jgi:hypothetical protein
VGFLKAHKDGTGAHSLRYLAELGLRPGDVQLGADGRPLLTRDDFLAAGKTQAEADAGFAKMSLAVNRWVDGAVLRPDASQKSIWMNDPHFALMAHMKQFSYAFHDTILKRIVHETQNGNYTPVMAMASYIPIMLAADLVKGAIQGGGEQPEWKKDWGAGDYLASATQRSGLLGVGQIPVDAFGELHRGGTGLGALAGPTVSQLGDIADTVGGSRQFEPTLVGAMPANALYSEYLPRSMTHGSGKNAKGTRSAPLEPIAD